MSRVGTEKASPVWWRTLFLGKGEEWWLVIDGERCRRISGYEAHAIDRLVDSVVGIGVMDDEMNPHPDPRVPAILRCAVQGDSPSALVGHVREVGVTPMQAALDDSKLGSVARWRVQTAIDSVALATRRSN